MVERGRKLIREKKAHPRKGFISFPAKGTGEPDSAEGVRAPWKPRKKKTAKKKVTTRQAEGKNLYLAGRKLPLKKKLKLRNQPGNP